MGDVGWLGGIETCTNCKATREPRTSGSGFVDGPLLLGGGSPRCARTLGLEIPVVRVEFRDLDEFRQLEQIVGVVFEVRRP